MSYSIELPINLKYCFSQYTEAPCGITSLIMPINLSDVDVMVYVIDKFNKEYSFFSHADSNGMVEIDLTLFPQGLFNPYGGNFNIYVTLAGFPKSERLFFRSTAGYFPGLELRIVDSLPINYQQFSNYYPDTDRFVCCCATGRTRCANITIDACTGLSLIPIPIFPGGGGGSSGSSGGGGNNPPLPCVPGLTYTLQNSWVYGEVPNGISQFPANIILNTNPLWVPDFTVQSECLPLFINREYYAFLVFTSNECCLLTQQQKLAMSNYVFNAFTGCDGIVNTQILMAESIGNAISPVNEFAILFRFFPTACSYLVNTSRVIYYDSSWCSTINIPECNFSDTIRINHVTILP